MGQTSQGYLKLINRPIYGNQRSFLRGIVSYAGGGLNSNSRLGLTKFTKPMPSFNKHNIFYKFNKSTQHLKIVHDSDGESSKKIKKQFYQKAVTLKLGLPANHPAKKMLISELLDKIQTSKIKQEEWQKFIMDEFDKFK